MRVRYRRRLAEEEDLLDQRGDEDVIPQCGGRW